MNWSSDRGNVCEAHRALYVRYMHDIMIIIIYYY